MKTEFAYKVLPEAKLAHDDKGNDTEAFLKIALDVKAEYATAKYDVAHKELIPFVAEQAMIDERHIRPISMKEYEAEHEDE
ncbi:hypothetical protein [Lysinibacillus sp. RS5]|uniref:hypothetical protein n=1 Tax=unclassified Lysinibacillus TaxID=2636778 RepID=UPI0035BE21A5